MILFQGKLLASCYLTLFGVWLMSSVITLIRRRATTDLATRDRGFVGRALLVLMLTNLVAIACLKYFPRATFATGATSVRHPAYAGLLLLAVGVGLCFGNAVSLGVIVVPMIALVLKRIEVEEDALVHTLGDSYRAYARRTKRLIPGLY